MCPPIPHPPSSIPHPPSTILHPPPPRLASSLRLISGTGAFLGPGLYNFRMLCAKQNDFISVFLSKSQDSRVLSAIRSDMGQIIREELMKLRLGAHEVANELNAPTFRVLYKWVRWVGACRGGVAALRAPAVLVHMAGELAMPMPPR